MHGINSTEVVTFSIVWTVAALAGLARVVSQRSTLGVGNIIGLAAASGFLGVAVVGLCVASNPDFFGANGFVLLGLAAAVGSLGKDANKVLWALLGGVFTGLKNVDVKKLTEDKSDNQEP